MEPAPLVTVCLGHRCAALLHHSETDGLGQLRQAVRSCAQAILVCTDCLGPCNLAPVMAVQQIAVVETPRLVGGPPVWLGPLDTAAVGEVAGWIQRGGPAQCPVPATLAPVVFHATAAGPGGGQP